MKPQAKTLYELRLCETRDYSPRLLDHWLHTLQKHPGSIEILIRQKDQKVQFFCTEDLSTHLLGSRFIETQASPTSFLTTSPKTLYFIHQKKGPLLPIKRYSQFEDRIQKTHISPLSTLIPLLAKTPNSFLHLQLIPLKNRQRERALKKVKQSSFEPERHFDQWESKAWFSFKARRFLGPLLRNCLFSSPLKTQKQEPQEQMESSHEREDPRHAILDKLSRPLFRAQITLSHPFKDFVHGFTLPYLGELSLSRKNQETVLSAEELASLLSLPNAKEQATYLHTEPTAHLPEPGNTKLEEEDRKRHLYLVGKTGMGKSTTLLHLFREDTELGRSIVVLDPHGDLIEDALRLTPLERAKDILLLDPGDADFPLALNPLELCPGENPNLKASALVEMFEVLAQGSWGPRLEYILRNALLLLILAPNTTLLDLPRLLTNEAFCRKMLELTDDFELHRFFKEEFLKQDPRTRQEHSAPILNKVGPLLTLPVLRNIFGQPKSKFSFKNAFAESKIVLISLPKGKLGEDASRILGMVFISMIQSTLLQRAELPSESRKTVCLTVDEFQNFTSKTLLTMLAESRKYGLALTLANQYLTQVPHEIQDAILGNVGSLLCFRTSYADAQILAPSLSLTEEDLTQLAPFQAYAKLLHQGSPLPLFRMNVEKTPPSKTPLPLETLKTRSRAQCARPVSLVEEKLKNRYNSKDNSPAT
jgi:hypothetical protein